MRVYRHIRRNLYSEVTHYEQRKAAKQLICDVV